MTIQDKLRELGKQGEDSIWRPAVEAADKLDEQNALINRLAGALLSARSFILMGKMPTIEQLGVIDSALIEAGAVYEET